MGSNARQGGSGLPDMKRDEWREIAVCGLLIAVTLGVFWPLGRFDFVNYDDPAYVTENARVRAGLTGAGVVWALTTGAVSNWHPLTWLSHMIDCQVFGLRPGAHHLVNVLIHTVNTVLLFLLLRLLARAAGGNALWRSAAVAALFAVHPLHVESVAWIAERKDVLNGLFWMLALLAYVHYASRPGIGRYLLVVCAFTLGLITKPMIVTLPCVLLLLDYWPLRRGETGIRGDFAKGTPDGSRPSSAMLHPFLRLLLEKLPLFALSAVSCAITLVVQRHGGAVATAEMFPFPVRVANALVAYARYLGKTVWPQDLIVVYPHSGHELTALQVLGAAALLVVITAAAIACARRRPYLLVGWFWFVGTLVPVIGLVQVGGQDIADRYTYVPLIGLFIVAAWGAADLIRAFPRTRIAVAVVTVVGIGALTVCTGFQVQYWRNSRTLFEHALHVTPRNSVAHNNLGTALMVEGQFDAAATHFAEAVSIAPNNVDALSNLGASLLGLGKADESARAFDKVLQLRPNDPTAHTNLGAALLALGQVNKAREAFTRALVLDPGCDKARQGLEMARMKDEG